jgi:hypothetical protein
MGIAAPLLNHQRLAEERIIAAFFNSNAYVISVPVCD